MQILGIIKNRQDLLHNLVFLLINLAIAFIILFRTAYSASDLRVMNGYLETVILSKRCYAMPQKKWNAGTGLKQWDTILTQLLK